MVNKTGIYRTVLVLLLTLVAVTKQQEINYDIEYMCGQMISVYDNDVVLNGRPSFAPADVPEDCIVELEAGYSDGSYRLQIIIEAIDINNCGVNLAIFNGRGGASGNYLRQVNCRSMTTDTLYTENKAATIRLHRPINVALDAYVFTIKTRAYKDDGNAAILRTGANLPDGAIAGIILALLALILFAILLAWCWKSGRISDYINNYKDDDEDMKGEENFATEKSESESVTAGTDKNPLVWNTTSSGYYDPKTVPLGRRSLRNARPMTNENGTSRDVTLTAANNGDGSAAWQSSQTDIKQALDREVGQGHGVKGRGHNGDITGHSSRGRDLDRDSKETLEDEVFESDGSKGRERSRIGEEGGRFTRGDQGRGSGGNRGSGRGDDARGSFRRAMDGSPNRGSLRRGEDIRESGRSTGSNKEEKKMARNLADEAATLQLRPLKSQTQVDPPSDFDSSSFMSVPEVATVTASVHAPRSPTPPPPPPLPPLPADNKSSDDSEVKEINDRAEQSTSAHTMPSSHHKESINADSKKSPSSRKKKKRKPKQEDEKDRVPPETFEPLFPNPVSEDPLPEGMQPLYGGMYGPQGNMYPMQPYGMPYGMMPPGMMPPGMMPGMAPPGSQSYSYAYQAAPHPGAPPQQVAGKAAWIVQETPTKDGPVQKTAFMMATESRPDSQQDSYHPTNTPGAPGYSSTPYDQTPRRKGSGRRGRPHHSGHPNDASMVPSGMMSPDSGHGHRSALMKSGVDPDTGIETRQALWTDTTRDPTDPPLNSDMKINRKTVTRTTTRGGYGNLPKHVDNITDHLFISMEPEDPAFLAPSGSGAHAITSTETPEQDNAAYYAGLHRSHHTSPHRAIHPAPHYHESIRDHISYA